MVGSQIVEKLTTSATDKSRISGLTHNFYRYPARFSPKFASTVIELFSKPGDLVLDPYMGGGTTIIEAMISGRRAIGNDLNSLSIFLTKVKTTKLSASEKKCLLTWANEIIPELSYHDTDTDLESVFCDRKMKNLNLPKARFIKKLIAAALASIEDLPSQNAKDFARCAILKTGQWALDGRKSHSTLSQFRNKIVQNTQQMLSDLKEFERFLNMKSPGFPRRKLLEIDASLIDKSPIFSKNDLKVDLVVTSPPYPGLHILYHRWQVDGRRETPAPYWIAGCEDGQGDSYYNFGNRQQPGLHTYFESSLRTLKAIRRVMRDGAYIVQMLAFKNPKDHLPRYLANMEEAGFTESQLCDSTPTQDDSRIWRDVPNRKWHAALKGNTSGSKEVVLVHRSTE